MNGKTPLSLITMEAAVTTTVNSRSSQDFPQGHLHCYCPPSKREIQQKPPGLYQCGFFFPLPYRNQLQQCHCSSDHLSSQQLPERLQQPRQSSGVGKRVRLVSKIHLRELY